MQRLLHPRLIRAFERTGHLDHCLGMQLYILAKTLTPKVIIETGTYFGYTAACIGVALHELGSGVLYTIDNDQRIEEEQVPVADRAEALCVSLDLGDYCVPAKGCSWEKTEEIGEKHGPIQLAHIDAGHTEEECRNDFEAIVKHLAPDGIIAIHDVVTLKGPRMALEALRKTGQWDSITVPVKTHYSEKHNRPSCGLAILQRKSG